MDILKYSHFSKSLHYQCKNIEKKPKDLLKKKLKLIYSMEHKSVNIVYYFIDTKLEKYVQELCFTLATNHPKGNFCTKENCCNNCKNCNFQSKIKKIKHFNWIRISKIHIVDLFNEDFILNEDPTLINGKLQMADLKMNVVIYFDKIYQFK